jgi:hypothetical protein
VEENYPNPEPTAEELHFSHVTLTALNRQTNILLCSGIPAKAIIVSMLLCAVKLATTTIGVTPGHVREMFELVMERYAHIIHDEEADEPEYDA